MWFILLAGVAAGIALWAWNYRRMAPSAASAPAVAGAAIRYSDLGTIALPLPKSHDDIRALVERTYGSRAGKHQGEIGYITNRGGFVKGHEALVIARQARQLRAVPLRGDVLELEYLRLPDKRRRAAPECVAPQPTPAQTGRRYVPVAAWMSRTAPSGQLVTSEHLHREFLRIVRITVPCLLLAGLLSVQMGLEQFSSVVLGAVDESRTAAPLWTIAAAQCGMYALLGLGLAMIIHARGSELRSVAVAAFAMLVAVNLLWAVSFDAQQLVPSLVLTAAMVVLAPVTVVLFGSIRANAAILTIPTLGWTGLATYSTLASYFSL
jgi:tryptophan-rich sensory protein